MRKRGLCCHTVYVCPSVRLSVTLVDCIQTTEDIIKLLSLPGSPIILVFDPERRYQFHGEPFSGALNTRWLENFAIFD